MTNEIRIKAGALEEFVRDVFIAAGSSTEEARRIGHYLVGANLTGHDSHGVIRVPRYVGWSKDGTIVPDQTIAVPVDTPVLAVVDGRWGYGQTVAPQAVKIGIGKCLSQGLAAVALKNSGHIGRVGDWAEMAAAEGLVSIHFVNVSGSVLVAPFGGVERRFSTAPYCVGVPRAGKAPIVLDLATSLVAEGKVLVASRGGKTLPKDALIATDGTVSDDPALFYGPLEPGGPRDYSKGTGAIRAFGEHKGSGLALICELLGGALTGSGATAPGKRFANGMFSVYVDPKRIDASEFFSKEVARYVAFVKSAKPTGEGGEVLVPGEPEERQRAERLARGVPLTTDTWRAITETARGLGLSAGRIRDAEAA